MAQASRDIFVQFGLLGVTLKQKQDAKAQLYLESSILLGPELNKIVQQCQELERISDDIIALADSIEEQKDRLRDLSVDERTSLDNDKDALKSMYRNEEAKLEKMEEECSSLRTDLPMFIQSVRYRLQNARDIAADAEREMDEDITEFVNGYVGDASNPPEEPEEPPAPRGVKIRGSYPAAMKERAIADHLASLGLPSGIQAVPPSVFGPQWRAVHSISGGMGQVHVLAEFDDNQNLNNRIVVKDTAFSDLETFRHFAKWYGPQENFVPIEYKTHRVAASNSRKVIRLLNRRPVIDIARLTYRLYLEYAGYGDLFELLENYYYDNDRLPKSFILYIFKALAEIAVVLKDGDGGNEIVHRDFKPENILLGMPDEKSFPNFTEPKLTDFGLAFMTNENDASNPLIWHGAGTPGYLAPEMVAFIDSKTGEPVDGNKMLSPCNVWGVGVIMYCLLHATMLDPSTQPTYLPGEKCEYHIMDPGLKAYYGHDLCELVNECLKQDPDRRPSPTDVQNEVANLIAGDKAIAQADQGNQDARDGMRVKKDDYRIGLSLYALFPDEAPAAPTA